MAHYQYLIVGGGMAAGAAIKGIREVDADGSIGLIGQENDPPYKRPPLTKGLWKGKSADSIWIKPLANVEMKLGRSVRRLDTAGHRVVDDRGEETAYDKVLFVTGGRPRHFTFGGDRVLYFRTYADYLRLQEEARSHQRFGVIGGGFIGSELAAALAMNGKEVVLIFPDEAIGSSVYPRDLALHLNAYYRGKGVEVMNHSRVVGIEQQGEQAIIRARAEDGGREEAVRVDFVVAGLGIEPEVELARDAGLRIENGVAVDRFLHASAPDVFAAGDCASFENPALGRRIRVEHEDNANTMGRMAGRNMAGQQEPYDHLPFFYSDLFDLGYEAVGDLSPRLELYSSWEEQYEKGVVYYLDSGRVRGVLLWNVWEQVEDARRLIAAPGPFSKQDLEGRVPAALV